MTQIARGVGAFLLAGMAARAPYQCGRAPDRAAREETPGEALYAVAQELRAQGDERGYRTTLTYLVRQFPSSRFAQAARLDLSSDASTSASTAGGR